MSRVNEWSGDFFGSLVEQSRRTDFPPAGSEYWDGFEQSLRRIGATWAHATEAVSLVLDTPNLFPADIRPRVIEEIRKLQLKAIQDSTGLDIAGSVEDARVASARCPDCGGNGSTVRFVHASILGKLKTAAGKDVPIGSKVSFPCSCPLGHHVARGQAAPGKPAPPTIDQYPSLRRVPCRWSLADDGLDNEFRHHPDQWDAYHGCPIPAEHPTHDLAALRAHSTLSKAPGFASGESRERSRENQLSAIAERPRAIPGPDSPPVETLPLPSTQPAKADILTDDEIDGWF